MKASGREGEGRGVLWTFALNMAGTLGKCGIAPSSYGDCSIKLSSALKIR